MNKQARFRMLLILLALGAGLSAGTAGAMVPASHDPGALEADPRTATGPIAPVLQGLGEHHFPVTTASPQAQQFFNQGLLLTYGFNHQEALRSFKEAARLDPSCAMAYWGWALVLGPNLNLPMAAEVVPQAHEAMQLAVAHAAGASEKEQALIQALALRYDADPEADRPALNAAYAAAMGKVRARWPADVDVGTLYAASLMNLSPWNYWTPTGEPRERTLEALDTLETVIARDPAHEGALHYHIHLVEAANPRRGERSADRLADLAPGAGHLMHMPSHIWMQLGRYAESVESNLKASTADEGYIAQCRSQGIYPLNYYPHNLHFLNWAAMMDGRSEEAMASARRVAARVPHDMHGNTWALFQSFMSMPVATMARFGLWDEIMAEPMPDENLRFLRGMHHFARGLAQVRQGSRGRARRELAALSRIVEDPETAETFVGFEDAIFVLTIGRHVLQGEMDAAAGRHDDAIAHLDRAVRLEDSITYAEPPIWPYPVRHTLGEILLGAGRPREAEVVFRQDLVRNPANGYALNGLWRALAAQDRTEPAREVRQQYQQAWSRADVELAGARF